MRRCLSIGLPAALLAFGAVQSAAAQVPLQSIEQAKQVRRALAGGAECLLATRMGSVKVFLAKFPTSKDGVRMARVLVAGDCVDGSSGTQELMFSPDVIRGALFKAMYIQKYSGANVRMMPNAPDFALDVGANPAALADPYLAVRKFGACVVARDPRASRDLVLAKVETDAEYTAFAALREPLATCAGAIADLPPVSRSMVVGAVAEVLYRSTEPVGG